MRSQSRGREARPELNTSLPHDVRMPTETQIYFLGLYWVYIYIRHFMKMERKSHRNWKWHYPLFSLTPRTIWRYHSDIFCSTPYHIYECRILKYSPLSISFVIIQGQRLWWKELDHGHLQVNCQRQCLVLEVYLWTMISLWQVTLVAFSRSWVDWNFCIQYF